MKRNKKEIQTHKTIEELVMLSKGNNNNMVRNVWQILQQGNKFFIPSFGNFWENGALREHAPAFAPALSPFELLWERESDKERERQESVLNEGARFCATPFPPRESP